MAWPVPLACLLVRWMWHLFENRGPTTRRLELRSRSSGTYNQGGLVLTSEAREHSKSAGLPQLKISIRYNGPEPQRSVNHQATCHFEVNALPIEICRHRGQWWVCR